MLLYELLTKKIPDIAISKKPTRDTSELGFDWLKDGGYTLPKKWVVLKHGTQASVFSHSNTNQAIKILYVEGTQDPSYQFLRLCLHHQDNIHFPKIYSFKQYSTNDPDVMKIIITMERLYRINQHNVNIVENLLNIKIDHPLTLKKQMKDAQFRKTLIMQASTPQLKQALKLMEPLFKHYVEDMHTGNIMLRKTGADYQVVFIDPVS